MTTTTKLAFSKDEAARLLSVSVATLNREIAERKITFRRVRGRILFTIADLERYLNRAIDRSA